MEFVRSAYNAVRPYLPRKIGVWAGVPVRCERLLDGEDYHPHYKQGLVEAIHEHVRDGETATLVGGGRGVSTVHCLRAGADRLVVYEAAEEMLEIARETVGMEQSDGRVDWRHGLVGEAVDVYGDPAGANTVHPAEIGLGDVLVLDCEGAERSILARTDEYPPTAIVETHPERGVATSRVVDLLEAAAYEVRERQYEPDQTVEEKRVLVGSRDD